MFPWLTPENGYIFRIMALDNLAHVLEHGIACRNCHHLVQQPNFAIIGEDDIITKRDERQVICAPFGVLADYVPFYFAPRSPMLYSISQTNTQAKENVIYVVSQIKMIAEAGTPFVFTDGHALMEFSRFSNKLANLGGVIDWDVMRAKYWHRTGYDNDRQRRRMAEFLVHQHFPVNCVRAIVVGSETAAETVREQLINFVSPIPVRIQPDWYF